ncbi:MAG: translation initiation factor IF-1 [Bryobacterales bacterium]|jgi:translation initiation factor IF-1|nr:translation initiation factor IF-1 [Bryobacterales bacterium]
MGSDPPVRGGRGSGVRGRILAALPRDLYRVELANRREVVAHPAGMVKRNFVRLLPGDPVEVELAPHDWTRARITRKLDVAAAARAAEEEQAL